MIACDRPFARFVVPYVDDWFSLGSDRFGSSTDHARFLHFGFRHRSFCVLTRSRRGESLSISRRLRCVERLVAGAASPPLLTLSSVRSNTHTPRDRGFYNSTQSTQTHRTQPACCDTSVVVRRARGRYVQHSDPLSYTRAALGCANPCAHAAAYNSSERLRHDDKDCDTLHTKHARRRCA